MVTSKDVTSRTRMKLSKRFRKEEEQTDVKLSLVI